MVKDARLEVRTYGATPASITHIVTVVVQVGEQWR